MENSDFKKTSIAVKNIPIQSGFVLRKSQRKPCLFYKYQSRQPCVIA